MANSSRREEGFVLLTVLLFTAFVAATGLSLETLSLANHRTIDTEIVEEESAVVLDSALNRSIYALEQTSDPLIAPARSAAGAVWQFDGQDVAITIAAESGKIDLNAAPLDFISSATNLALGKDKLALQTLVRISEERQAGRAFKLADAALAPADRFGPEATRFRQDFTVFSNQAGIDPLDAPNDVLHAVPDATEAEIGTLLAARAKRSLSNATAVMTRLRQYFAPERPIYRITATLLGHVNHSGRTATVIVNQNQHRARIFMWRDIPQPIGRTSRSG